MRLAPIIASLAALAVCATYDLGTLAQVQPMGDGTYRWQTVADAIYPVDSAAAEAKRIEQMGRVMGMQPDCADGATVTDRQAIKRVNGLAGDIYDIFYTVRCV